MKGGDSLDFQEGGNLRKGGVDLEKKGGMTPLANYEDRPFMTDEITQSYIKI